MTNRYKKFTLYALIILTLIHLHSGCQNLSKYRSSGNKSIEVTITKIATNDLGQVMVFGLNEDIENTIFVKNFFSKGKNKKDIKKEIEIYRQNIEKFNGKYACINYYENKIGDWIILKIKKINN